MDAQEILVKAKSGDAPANWAIVPLQRMKVAMGIFSWIIGLVAGGGLLALIVPIVIPNNFQRGIAAIIFTILILGFLLFVAAGSLYLLVVDLIRLVKSEDYLIVITDKDFVHQQGRKTIHVPLSAVSYVTARGKIPADAVPGEEEEEEAIEEQRSHSPRAGLFGGRAADPNAPRRPKQRRSPTSLAFVDTRTNKEVVVVNDDTYGNPHTIAAVLREYCRVAS